MSYQFNMEAQWHADQAAAEQTAAAAQAAAANQQVPEYESEHIVNMCICYFEGGHQPSPTLTQLENAVTNLLESGTPEDQQVAQIIQNDFYAFVPVNSPNSVETESDEEGSTDEATSEESDSDDDDSEDELNMAFNTTPWTPPRVPLIRCLSPIYETPENPVPPPPYDVIEFPLTDETIEWADDAFEDSACRIAARYDTVCDCCKEPVKIELFH
jgi:hypothetical protein